MEAAGPDIAARVRAALGAADLAAFGELLADDVRWGEPGFPGSCRNRGDVLDLLRAGEEAGATASIGECVAGARGILCELHVRWPERATGRPTERHLFHVYVLAGGRIVEIQPFDGRAEAAAAAGIAGARAGPVSP